MLSEHYFHIEISMSKDNPFGLRKVFCTYFWKDFLLDSIIPSSISSFLCIVMCIEHVNVYVQLKELLDISISIVPSMVALVLAAYTILLSFILGKGSEYIKNSEEGKNLILILNSSFAACLIISAATVIISIFFSCLANIHICIEHSDIANYFAFFLTAYLLTYSVTILIGIVIDIFNIGQTIFLD